MIPVRRALALGACLALVAASAVAQVPPQIAEQLRKAGRVIEANQSALYTSLHGQEPFAGVKVTRDQTYGPDPRHRLDVFTPDKAGGKPRPVLLFVHGGGFVRGDKHEVGSPFYDNVLVWSVKNGMVGVNMTYRLAPANKWPAGAEDIGSAVAWIKANIAHYGGDPNQVYLMGHSAGASHVAAYVAHERTHKVKGGGLAGAIMVSGNYDLLTSGGNPAYYGDDKSVYPSRSSFPGLLKTKTPLMIAYAELDPPAIEAQAVELSDARCKEGRCIRTVKVKDESHLSEIFAINTPDVGLSDPLLQFLRTGK